MKPDMKKVCIGIAAGLVLAICVAAAFQFISGNVGGISSEPEKKENIKTYEVVKFQLPNGNTAHHEIKTFECFKEYYPPGTDIKILEEDYDKYVKSFEPIFTDSRLNVSYEVISAEYSYTGSQIVYKIFYLDNNEIKYATLPYREKKHRADRMDRINEHLIKGYASTNNESTLTLTEIDFQHYPVTDDGFNVYKWELYLKPDDIISESMGEAPFSFYNGTPFERNGVLPTLQWDEFNESISDAKWVYT